MKFLILHINKTKNWKLITILNYNRLNLNKNQFNKIFILNINLYNH